MDLRQLEYFVRVAELGSFTRASVALGIAQPALSRQVRLLEVELRQTLLARNGRGAVPTEAGKLLLEHGRGILHQVARAREDLGRVRGSLAGRVALGLPPSLARVLTVPLTRAFRQRLPEASLSIGENLSNAMIEGIQQGRLDIAVLYNATPTPGIDLVPLMEEDLLLVQARGSAGASGSVGSSALPRRSKATAATAPTITTAIPAATATAAANTSLSLADLARLPLVIPSRPNAIRMLVEAELATLGLRPSVALEIDGVSAILDLVADGAGAAVLPRSAVTGPLRPDAYVHRTLAGASPGQTLRIRLAMAVSAQRPATLTQQSALELLREIATKLLTPAAGGDVGGKPESSPVPFIR